MRALPLFPGSKTVEDVYRWNCKIEQLPVDPEMLKLLRTP